MSGAHSGSAYAWYRGQIGRINKRIVLLLEKRNYYTDLLVAERVNLRKNNKNHSSTRVYK